MSALRTLASCWTFKKRAFSVSGKFRQLLADLIKTKHNSNHKTDQTTLEGEIVQEYTYYVLGFVSAEAVPINRNIWFSEGLSYAGWGMGAFFTGLGLFVIYLGRKELYVSDRGKLAKETLE